MALNSGLLWQIRCLQETAAPFLVVLGSADPWIPARWIPVFLDPQCRGGVRFRRVCRVDPCPGSDLIRRVCRLGQCLGRDRFRPDGVCLGRDRIYLGCRVGLSLGSGRFRRVCRVGRCLDKGSRGTGDS